MPPIEALLIHVAEELHEKIFNLHIYIYIHTCYMIRFGYLLGSLYSVISLIDIPFSPIPTQQSIISLICTVYGCY